MNFKKRQHPLGIVLNSIKIIRDISLPVLVFLVTHVLRNDFPAWLMVVAIAMLLIVVAIGVLSWLRFTYTVSDRDLIVEHGILVRKKTAIPRERVQSIDYNQGLLHRLFGVVNVQVETAGGTKPEVVLAAVSRQDAREIRRILQKESRYGETIVPDRKEELCMELPASDLLLFGATSGSGLGVVLTIFAGIWSSLDDIGLEFNYEALRRWFELHGNTIEFIFALLLALWVIAITGMVVKYGGFRLTRSGESIHVTYGLLYCRQFSIPLSRIQAIRLVEGPLRQPMGLVTLQVESAGYGRQSADKALLWPILKQRNVPEFLRNFLPEFTDSIPLQPLPPGTRHRYVLRALLPSVLVALPISAWLFKIDFSYYFAPLSLPALAALIGLWNHRDAGWGIQGDMLTIRFRFFSRTRVIIPRRCVQSLTISYNPFQLRAGLVTFSLDLASKARFGLAHVSTATGARLADWFNSND